jgi:hypothetical protein
MYVEKLDGDLESGSGTRALAFEGSYLATY